MDLKDLIAKMDQIEQQPVQLNEDTEQVNEVAPLVLVGLGMGLKWLWDKYQQSQDEADAAKKAAEDAKRAGDAAEAARLAAEAARLAAEAEEDKKRAQDAYNSKCKEKVGQANVLLSQLEDLLKAKVKPAAAPAVPAAPTVPAAGPTILGKIPLNEKCKTCGVEYKDHFIFDKNGKIEATKIKHPTFQGDFPGMAGMPRTGGSIANENFNIADSLLESFGYTLEKKDQLDEWSMQDTGDTIRGAYNGLTFGAGDNITAGVKSAFGKDTYAQALEKERAETEKAQARSPSVKFNAFGKEWNPSAYDAANLAGAIAVPIPGVGLAGAAAAKGVKTLAGAGKVAKGVAGTAKLGTELGATYGALKGAEHVLNKHTVSTLVANKGGDPRVGMAQAAMGFNDTEVDGKIGKLTMAALEIVQQENGLPVTRKLDDATAKVLGV
jgi:hypothetical protein